MKVGRDYAWWVSYSWTYEWLEEESGEWISKKALEECKQHYCKVADKFNPKPNKQELDFRYPVYLGKADVLTDILKHFEPLEL